ncbi:hypothetical protein GDO78_014925 [Eleutherodactylus coqui]|uniref:Uncharacterized protein n=1 Tax=Eleutherodactylus coqui TaxID=57060 RepID=A0A8J6B7H4_ELECQ|nr:hypothetical protein GDO78_014925 [Eleutherodactylus coqui]
MAAILSMCASGGLPVAISNTVHPILQMSDFSPCPDSLMTSGAIQYGVPCMDCSISPRVPFMLRPLRRFAQPKSMSFMTPFGISMTLLPLMSRCTTLFLCR